jgi:lipoprotein-anchoring transpeptidase ErfK/SrfK
MKEMELKAETTNGMSKGSLLLLSGLVTLMLAVGLWIVYAVFFRVTWMEQKTVVPPAPQASEEVVLSQTLESDERIELGDEGMYQEKYHEALRLLGTLPLTEYLVVVDISEQREYLFEKGGSFIQMYTVSTGGTRVKVGTEVNDQGVTVPVYANRAMGESVWRISEKLEGNLSPIYGPRLMMLDRLTRSGWIQTDVALHGTNEPEILGTPQSLGCVYHDNADIIPLYDMLAVGTLVVSIK